MARFDVFQYHNPAVPLVLEVQANLLSGLSTCAVIPLVPEKTAGQEVLPKLKPVIDIDGENYIVMTTDIGTVTRASLGKRISNVEDKHRQTIIDALDFLFQGF